MIKNLFFDGDIGFIKTDKQFAFIIEGEIYGPFQNEEAVKVYKKLKQEEK